MVNNFLYRGVIIFVMRHSFRKKILNMNSAHRASVMRNLAVSLLQYGKINTTLAKAKVLKAYIEKMITIAKNSDELATKKMLISRLSENGKDKLYELADKFKERKGGYTRIVKTWSRTGDRALTGRIEFVD